MRTSSARIRVSVALLLLATPVAAQQNARGIRTADLHQLRSVEDVQLSPDGRLIAYVVSNRERPGRPYSQIWIATVASGEARRLGAPTENGSGPRWSPDGRWRIFQQ
jgi:dipeptidyl aminopeptidase/acylaminoacyl peptidase